MQNSSQGFRLSPQQRRLWTRQQSNPAPPYRAVASILLEGELQPRVLEHALHALVQRHEILRTTFRRPPGIKTPFQIVSDNVRPGWQALDLSQLDAAHQRHRIELSFAEEQARPVNFERDTLLRLSVFKLSSLRRVMIISLPALCADAATLTNFVSELCDIYDSLLQGGQPSDQDGEVMQYADFAEWQNELVETEDEQSLQGKAYWKELADTAASAVLPLEQASVDPGASFSPASVKVVVDKDLYSRIERLALESEVTIESLIFSSWQAVLWRLTGQSDFLVFNLAAGRNVDELKRAFGPYATYLPVRCHCEDTSFAELVRTGAGAGQGRQWQEYYEANDSEANNVAFEFAERPAQFVTSGLTFSILQLEMSPPPFKLKLSCLKIDKTLIAELQYDTRVFTRETVLRFAGYWQRLLTAGAPAATSRNSQTQPLGEPLTLGQVEVLSPAERRWLLFELNKSETVFETTSCIHELFEQQVARTPEAVALVFGEEKLTYNQLNARANQLAHLLRLGGVSANDRVGLCVSRSGKMIIGLLGILKAGGAYVPLNPEHPRGRLASQLAESNASVLITDSGLKDPALEFTGETIDLQLQRDRLFAQPQENPETSTTADNFVYVIYTSGSTGISKGVAVQHRNLVNYTNFILRRLKVTEPLNFAFVSTIAADLGNTCIFPSLLSGGCLHILNHEVAMDGALFKRYFAEHPIDVLKIVPSHFQALLAAEPDGNLLPAKFLLLGGEALSPDLVQRIFSLSAGCRLINHYGPTETTVGSLIFEAEWAGNYPFSLTVPIGKPIANTQVYVLDRLMQPQPTGVTGELYIGGAGVSAGYLNQPAETALRFVADPFAVAEGRRLYRTGDLARYLPDGNVEFIGRLGNQIKVRGFRVELGEVEANLLLHPLIQQAVVCASGPAGLNTVQQLVAYIVPSGSAAPRPEVLREFLKLRLPDYMIPAVFVSLPSFPLTANGKIDRAALPAPEDIRPVLQQGHTAARNETESKLVNIWAAVLGVNEIGVHDNFFDLGGHSLLATQVVSRMRQVFQTEIPLASIFQSPTVAALAESIDSVRMADTENLVAQLEQLSEDEVLQLLRAEELKSE